MYDNVKFWIDRLEIGEDIFQALSTYLTNAKEIIDRDTGEAKTTGFLANLRVMINESGMSVKGSLSRFYHWEEVTASVATYILSTDTTHKRL